MASLACLRDASLSLLPGALSEWLADHPVMINSVLPLVLHALGNPELSVSSVSTLKKICRECKYDLPPYAANIVAVSQVRDILSDDGPQATLHCPNSMFLLLFLGCTDETDPQGMAQKFLGVFSRVLQESIRPQIQSSSFAPYLLFSLFDFFPKSFVFLPPQPDVVVCVFCPTDKPMHVADAGAGLSAVSPAGGGDPEEPALTHLTLYPAAGEAGGGDSE